MKLVINTLQEDKLIDIILSGSEAHWRRDVTNEAAASSLRAIFYILHFRFIIFTRSFIYRKAISCGQTGSLLKFCSFGKETADTMCTAQC